MAHALAIRNLMWSLFFIGHVMLLRGISQGLIVLVKNGHQKDTCYNENGQNVQKHIHTILSSIIYPLIGRVLCDHVKRKKMHILRICGQIPCPKIIRDVHL